MVSILHPLRTYSEITIIQENLFLTTWLPRHAMVHKVNSDQSDRNSRKLA